MKPARASRETEAFEAEWLALREPFDAASRSVALAQRLAEVLPASARLVDLGAGTGSLFRFLAPVIGRAQAWTLVDADAELLAHGLELTARWAAWHGFGVDRRGDGLALHTPAGIWQMRAVLQDLAEAAAGDADVVVCSALLDVVSADWIERFVAGLRVPLLACLSVDGRDVMRPSHAFDRVVASAFRRDQGRDKGFGPALGPRAPSALRKMLLARGFSVTSVASDWRIPCGASVMLQALLHGQAEVAMRVLPARRGDIAAWERLRLRQIAAGRLALGIGHRDILAVPGED